MCENDVAILDLLASQVLDDFVCDYYSVANVIVNFLTDCVLGLPDSSATISGTKKGAYILFG